MKNEKRLLSKYVLQTVSVRIRLEISVLFSDGALVLVQATHNTQFEDSKMKH